MTHFIELNRFCTYEDKTFGVLHVPQVSKFYLTVERMGWGVTEPVKTSSKKRSGYELAKHCLVPKLYNLGCEMRTDLTFKVTIKGSGYLKKASFETGKDPYKHDPGSIMLFKDGLSYLEQEKDQDALDDFDDYMGNLYMYGQFSGNNRVAMLIQDNNYLPQVSKAGLGKFLERDLKDYKTWLMDADLATD